MAQPAGRPPVRPPARRVAVLTGTQTGYNRDVLRGIIAYGRRHAHWDFYVSRWRGLAGMGHLGAWDGDGVIVYLELSDRLKRDLPRSIPAVSVSSRYPPTDVPLCIPDHAAIGRLAADHLLGLGLRHFAYVGQPRHWGSRQRADGFVRAIGGSDGVMEWSSNGVKEAATAARPHSTTPSLHHSITGPPLPTFHGCFEIDPDASDEASRAAMGRWLAALPKPVGVLAFNDDHAERVPEAARRAGLDVPGDVAVVGVDNDDLVCDVTTPPLTSVDSAADRVGYEAAALLARLMDGESPPAGPVLVPPRGVVVRQSTDQLTVADADVAAAIRFIRLRAADGIDVRDVVAAVPVSRRTLERRFRDAIGHSLHEEIRRQRMERARSLLTETDLPLADVAAACHFKHPAHFTHAFRRHAGTTPGAYRRRMGRQ